MKKIVFLIILAFSISILASDGDKDNSNDGHHSLNHIAVFNGVTTTAKETHNYYTLGIDYVRQFSETGSFGIGVFAEIIFADHKEYALGIPLYYKIAEGFWLRTGPGVEILKEAKETENVELHGTEHLSKLGSSKTTSSIDPHAELEDKVKFLYRVGLMYTFHVGQNFGISPSVDFDLVEKHNAFVYGINLGWAF